MSQTRNLVVSHTPATCVDLAHEERSAFDPKPFIAGFEATVDKLISLRKDIQVKSEQMEKSVRVSEREYSKKMTELNRRFEVRSMLQ
jgi:hypothetical protein